ncbi:hypothetical protein BJP50_28320 [Paenibacillus odorifer]|nr:hypothetical protein BJP50_28320 [Paenibacillus odorifer]
MREKETPLNQVKKRNRGRPPAENPKVKRTGLRLDDESAKILQNYCEINNVDSSEAIRTAIKLLGAKVNDFGGTEWKEKVQQSQQIFNEATTSINKLLKNLYEVVPYENKGKGDKNENE